MNRIYEVDEGRPVWKLRPLNILVSLIVIVGAAILLLSVDHDRSVRRADQRATRPARLDADRWSVAKWPLC